MNVRGDCSVCTILFVRLCMINSIQCIHTPLPYVCSLYHLYAHTLQWCCTSYLLCSVLAFRGVPSTQWWTLCSCLQMHQHPMGHHDHVSSPLNQVAQQPMPHQPIAIDHHHMQQLQPLSQQLQMQMQGQPQQLQQQMQEPQQQLHQQVLDPQQHLHQHLHESSHQQYQQQLQEAEHHQQQHLQQHMQEPLPSMVEEIKAE